QWRRGAAPPARRSALRTAPPCGDAGKNGARETNSPKRHARRQAPIERRNTPRRRRGTLAAANCSRVREAFSAARETRSSGRLATAAAALLAEQRARLRGL